MNAPSLTWDWASLTDWGAFINTPVSFIPRVTSPKSGVQMNDPGGVFSDWGPFTDTGAFINAHSLTWDWGVFTEKGGYECLPVSFQPIVISPTSLVQINDTGVELRDQGPFREATFMNGFPVSPEIGIVPDTLESHTESCSRTCLLQSRSARLCKKEGNLTAIFLSYHCILVPVNQKIVSNERNSLTKSSFASLSVYLASDPFMYVQSVLYI